jgi:hypothetical protein
MRNLECIICSEMYDLDDAVKGAYYIQTRVCASCYKKGMQADVAVWCFGKLFSSKRVECTTLCPDREICKHFTTRSKR